MSYASAHSELRTRFSEQCESLFAGVAWPNVKFDKPEPPSLWARFHIQDLAVKPISIGGVTNYHRHLGILTIQMFEPFDCGSGNVQEQADLVAAAFRNWSGNFVVCESVEVNNIGEDGKGYYQVNVKVPFYRDELF